MEPTKLKYDRCCVDCDDCVDDLNKMTTIAIQITHATMLKNCEGVQEWARAHGYTRDLSLRNDWSVGFFKSSFQGQRCYFLQWSAIEYIWTPNGSGNIASSYGVINHD